jgi:hypothetical protein
MSDASREYSALQRGGGVEAVNRLLRSDGSNSARDVGMTWATSGTKRSCSERVGSLRKRFRGASRFAFDRSARGGTRFRGLYYPCIAGAVLPTNMWSSSPKDITDYGRRNGSWRGPQDRDASNKA